MSDNKDMERVAFGLAKVACAGGIIGMVLWLSPVPPIELLSFFLFWMLPVLLLGAALGLISQGTLQAIWTGSLAKRFEHWRGELKKNPQHSGPVPS